MKKQIITIVSVAVAAILLFVGYSIFFDKSDIDQEIDPFYVLYANVAEALKGVDEKAEITLCGYDSSDNNWVMIYRFSQSIVQANDKFSVSDESESGFKGVRVTSNGSAKEIPFDDFFKTLYDGTYYAFDGEALISNAILSLNGLQEVSVEIRPLDGYDADGDTVTGNGAPLIFPAMDRYKISHLTVRNDYGQYSVFQSENQFYFGSSIAALYDDDKFSQVVTSMRYVITNGKMELPEGQTWENYGLNGLENSKASYSIITTPDADGTYKMHTVLIGEKSSTGSYYYARYLGAVYDPEGNTTADITDDRMVCDLTKDFIYFIPTATVEEAIMLPETDMMKPILVNGITQTQEIFTIDNIRIDYYDKGVNAVIRNFKGFNPADNLAALNSSKFDDCISDKKSAKEYSSYEGGWTKHTDVFGGFTSSDGKNTYIDAALAKHSDEGKYTVKFGLLRDESNGAYLPGKVTISISYDGNNWHSLENGTITPNQSNGSVQQYELSFNDDRTVKFVRIGFDVPQLARTYVVFDEIRIFIGDVDAQPVDMVNGIWKLVSPTEHISTGRNYAHLDMNNFNNFVQALAVLQGEKVVDCGFSDNGDASPAKLDMEKLKKYGLDKPARHYAFVYDEILCDIYVSAPNEEGIYYAYSTYSGTIKGKEQIISTDVIVQLTKTSAEWLDWDFVEFLDSSIVTAFFSELSDCKISFEGNEYYFLLNSNESDSDIESISYNGKSMDVTSFKYIYKSLLSVYMQDEYKLEEGETGKEYLRVEFTTDTETIEIVFYRVSSTKCYFTVNGEGSYYALVEQVSGVRERVAAYVAGQLITE